MPFAVHVKEYFEDQLFFLRRLEDELKDPGTSEMRAVEIKKDIESLREILEETDMEDKSAFEEIDDPIMAAIELADALDLDIDLDMTESQAKDFLIRHRGQVSHGNA